MHFALSQDFLYPYQNNLHLLRHFLASKMYEVGPGTDPFKDVRIIVRKVLSRRRDLCRSAAHLRRPEGFSKQRLRMYPSNATACFTAKYRARCQLGQ
jgi:hypothetical protein